MLKIKWLLLGFVLIANNAFSQDEEGFFGTASFGKPFLSEISSTLNKVDMGYGKNRPEYDISYTGRKYKPYVDIHLGAIIPFYLKHFRKDSIKTWSIAVSTPVSIHVWEDMFEKVTAPVLNNDYRFSFGSIKAIKYLNQKNFIKNFVISLTPVNHECTHIGDELTIYRLDEGLPLTRINVSYEYSELSFTINDPDGSRENLNSFKLGMMYRYSDRGQGWYSLRSAEGDTSLLTLSNIRTEFYLEYQLQRSSGFLASKRCVNVFSIEGRERLRYGYEISTRKLGSSYWTEVTRNEKRVLCTNIYLGYRFYPKSSAKAVSSVGFFLNAYAGVNYHGMFRNYSDYRYLGISLIVQ